MFCVSAILTCLTDIISAYTISYPDLVPVLVNQFFAAVFIYLYNSSLVVFLLYVDSLTKIMRLERPIRIFAWIVFAYYTFFFILGFFTKTYVYFDENLVYRHGIVFYINYLVAAFILVGTVIMIIRGRVRFSIFQQIILIFFICGVIAAIGLQLIFTDVLLAGFSSASVSVCFLLGFENPAYYCYKDSRCPNREAFSIVMKSRRKSGQKTSIILAGIKDFPTLLKTLRTTQRENMWRSIADRIFHKFHKNAFLIRGDAMAVIVPYTEENLYAEIEIQKALEGLFEEPVNLRDSSRKLNIFTTIIPGSFEFNSNDEMESVINTLLRTEKTLNQTTEIMESTSTAIEKKRRRDLLVKLVKKAIEENSFQVYYQPIFNIKSGAFESAEALVRLIDSEYGFISPEEFIPITEEEGLILPLGEIVFEKVCSFLSSFDYKSKGLKYIEVNVSPVQCREKNIKNVFLDILYRHHIGPSAIVLEITETAETSKDAEKTIIDNINSLSRTGMDIAIDDFGSGFAAMDYLFKMPSTLVKVDKGILWQAMENKNAMTVLENTVRMVSDLKRDVLVEGVEDENMVEVLRGFGVKFMQGYYYSKPIPEAAFLEFLDSHK